MKSLSLVIAVCIACAYLSLKQLDNTYFWDDEAHVGIIARNFLATGHLTGWDGRNLFAFRNGTLLDAQLHIINPPIEYLVTAGSFWIFGASTWAGRFPFVIAGLLGLVVFSRLLPQVARQERWLWGYALAGLALSPAFLLNIRQCRYYALSLLFSLLTFYFYRRCLCTRRVQYFIALALTATLVFYSNHLLGMAFLLALGVVHGVFHRRDLDTRDWGKIAAAAVIFVLATIPYALFYQIWDRPDIPTDEVWYIHKLKLLWWNLRDLNLVGYLPWTVAAGLSYFFVRHRTSQQAVVQTAKEWLTLGVGYVVFLALFSPQPTKVPTIADVRYLIPALPFLIGAGGIFLWYIHQRMPAVAVTLFMVSVTSNTLTLTPFNHEFRWLLPAYLQEIHQDYPTAYREVVHFLEKNTAQDDLIVTYPQHTNYPLMFYVGDKLRFCCLLNTQTRLPRHQIARLPASLFIEHDRPEWLVTFGAHPMTAQLLAFFSQPSQHNGNTSARPQYHLVDILDVYWQDTHRPELPWHSFGAKTDFDRRSEAVYIFKRREATELGASLVSPAAPLTP
jgi:hypothetical protein